ncbi:MAG: PDZ domain-containing protein [Planctomycetota bacterium]
MKGISVALMIGLAFVVGCEPRAQEATVQEQVPAAKPVPLPPVPSGYVRRPVLGCTLTRLADGRVSVDKVREDTGAAKAGLRSGDVIVEIDGRRIENRCDVLDALWKKQHGERVHVTIQRDGSNMGLDAELGCADRREDTVPILRALWQEKKVRLAILVGEITNVGLTDRMQLEQWTKAIRGNLLTENESSYLEGFQPEPGFSLVDRRGVEDVLKELDFAQTGAVSNELRAKLGGILGATHLLVIEYSRFTKLQGANEDMERRRLIEIETGRVLCSVMVHR